MIKLKKGDIVDIVAPASLSDSKELHNAYKEIKKWGLIPRSFIDFDASHPFHSDEDEFRFQDLKRALLAPDSKLIWCLRGGYGSARLLDRLSRVKKPVRKKLLVGYSDITALHAFFNQKWGWETIHGPTISSFSNKTLSKKSLNELKEILFVPKTKFDFVLHPLNDAAKNLKTKIEGKIVGGNLATVQTLLATKYQLSTKNKILVLEDVNERGYHIDRMLLQLSMSGMLKGCKAIIFGEFTLGTEPNGQNYVELALDRFAVEHKIPVFRSSEFGHGKINRPLLLNHLYQIKNNFLIGTL